MKRFSVPALSLLIAVSLLSCGSGGQPYDSNTAIGKGEPPFIPLGQYWVIDPAGLLSQDIIVETDRICQGLKEAGIAEVVVLVQTGIKDPDKYATHYGRWLKLGKPGSSVEGGNNGIVWLIRPDARDRITISVGRGLPEFSSADYGQVMDKALDYVNFNNFDAGVLMLVKETDKKLRSIYKRGGA